MTVLPVGPFKRLDTVAFEGLQGNWSHHLRQDASK
jgi:hypothetical protein